MTIPDPVGRSKALFGRIPADILMILVLILASSASFGLGVLAGKDMQGTNPDDRVWIEQLPQSVRDGGGSAAALSGVESVKSKPKETPAPTGPQVYVASKNGTKFYLPSCGTAKRIKEENKVWFATKEEAAAAGYEPSATCKGL